MPSSLFEAACVRVRAMVGEDDWGWLSELQRADLICCEMYRLAKVERDVESAPDLPLPKKGQV